MPRRPSPTAFYTEYLPRLVAAIVPKNTRLPFIVQLNVEINSDNTQSFDLTLNEQGLLVQKQEKNPDFAVFCNKESWEVATYDLWPKFIKHFHKNLSFGTNRLDRWAHRLRTMLSQPGAVDIFYVDDAGDVARFALVIGSSRGPRAQVTLADRDLWHILAAPTSLSLLQNRVRVEGDIHYAMSLIRLSLLAQ